MCRVHVPECPVCLAPPAVFGGVTLSGDFFADSKYPRVPAGFLTRHALAVEAYTVHRQGDRRKVADQTHRQSHNAAIAAGVPKVRCYTGSQVVHLNVPQNDI